MANLSTGKFLVNYGIEVKIRTAIGQSPTPDTYSVLGDGITNISEALNEVKQQMYYLINKGFGQTEVTAMHPAITFTGHRLEGDTAQDFIFGKKFKLGADRKTIMQVKVFDLSATTETTFDSYQVDVTICDVQEYSGATENGSDISFTLEFNGAPSAIPAQ